MIRTRWFVLASRHTYDAELDHVRRSAAQDAAERVEEYHVMLQRVSALQHELRQQQAIARSLWEQREHWRAKAEARA